MLAHADIEALAQLLAPKILEEVARLQKRWLSLQEAKDLLDIRATNTMMKLINEGRIYATKRTGKWLVDRQSIDNWLMGDY